MIDVSEPSASADDEPRRSAPITTPYFVGESKGGHAELRITRDELTDSDNVEEFGELLAQVCDASDARWLLIDVSELQYVTSSILSRFITLNRRLSREDGDVVLVAPSEMFDDVLQATNLSNYFHVTPTLQAARDALP